MRTPVCILGAGPHGLAMLLHLLHADPELRGRVTVLDPSGAWLTGWENRFRQLEIETLRSPSVHHPAPDVDAYTRYVAHHGLMTSELPYDPPVSAGFLDFCRHLVDAEGVSAPLPHRPVAVTREGAELRVETGGPTLLTPRLVVATNPHRRVIPPWVWPILGTTRTPIAHADDVDLPALPDLDDSRVVVIGGGLSAGHLACGAISRGATVHLVARRALHVRSFDTDPGWLGPRFLRDYDATPDPRVRLTMARKARGGGTVPPWMHDRLCTHEAAGNLRVHQATVADAAAAPEGCRLALDDGTVVDADHIWLATGTTPDLDMARCLDPLRPDMVTIEGFPLTDGDLRAGAHPVHVMGRLATLTLGPAAGNLWGARQAARRITRAVTGVEIDPLG